MTRKPFSEAVRADQYQLLCLLLQRMIKAEHGSQTIPAPVDEDSFLGRGWTSYLSECETKRLALDLRSRARAANGSLGAADSAVRDSNAWLGDYKHKHDSRLRAVKDRATGKVETERMPGQVWLALRSLYADSLFVPLVAARASKALTKRQGRVRRTPNHCASLASEMPRLWSLKQLCCATVRFAFIG